MKNDELDPADYLNDIRDGITKALHFIDGYTFEEFTRDDKTIFAVIRA